MTQGYHGSISKTRFWHEHQMQCLLVTQKRATIPTLPAQIQKCHVAHLKGLPLVSSTIILSVLASNTDFIKS